MAETDRENIKENRRETDLTKSRSLPRWGCFLVILFIIALFAIIFFYGQFAAIPNNNSGIGP